MAEEDAVLLIGGGDYLSIRGKRGLSVCRLTLLSKLLGVGEESRVLVVENDTEVLGVIGAGGSPVEGDSVIHVPCSAAAGVQDGEGS